MVPSMKIDVYLLCETLQSVIFRYKLVIPLLSDQRSVLRTGRRMPQLMLHENFGGSDVQPQVEHKCITHEMHLCSTFT